MRENTVDTPLDKARTFLGAGSLDEEASAAALVSIAESLAILAAHAVINTEDRR